MRQSHSLLFFLPCVLIGCTVGPTYVPPVMDLPCEWHAPTSEGIQNSSPQNVEWWENLNDPILSCLIQQAYEQNFDLQIAATRILSARNIANGKKGDLYPHIDASANYANVNYSKDGLVNGLLGSCDDHCKRPRNVNFFEVGFDAEWEIDFFGMTQHEIKALKAQAEASEEALCDLWITLSAEIAKSYIYLRGSQQRLIILEKKIQSQRSTLEMTVELFDHTLVSSIDQQRAKEQLSLLLSQKPLLQLEIAKAIHHLSILLGLAPGELYCELITPTCLPQLPCEKPIGVPSELLQRRPDIRKAERELAAATERVGSAIAALFPRFSLRGFIGDISTKAGTLFNGSNVTWLAGPQLLIPIFNSKLLLEDVEYNRNQVRQSLYQYQKTVLEALEETENAIASFHYELEHTDHLNDILISNQNSLLLTQELYDRGIKGSLDVLEQERLTLTAEEAHIQGQTALVLHYISLYKSLGGYWDVCDCKTSTTQCSEEIIAEVPIQPIFE